MIPTKDGANTLYSQKYQEHYHSMDEGALTESMKKHVKPALLVLEGIVLDKLNVLDICFGLGYNSLCLLKCWHGKANIISPELDTQLVYSLRDFEYPAELASMKNIIYSISEHGVFEDEQRKLKVVFEDALDVVKNIEHDSIDIVFQDAFSPKNNPELWSEEYFKEIHRILNLNGVVTTYSKSNTTRSAMRKAGFILHEHSDDTIRSGTIAMKKMSDKFPIV